MATPGLGLLRVPLLAAESADETTSTPVNVLGYKNLTIYVTGTGTIASGVITIEEADFNPSTESDYSGTWSVITTVTASGVTGGAQQAIHLTPSAYSQVRTRISTAIGGGGSVSTTLVAV